MKWRSILNKNEQSDKRTIASEEEKKIYTEGCKKMDDGEK